MNTATVNGVELQYEVVGSGEPLLLIHGAHIADALLPLMTEPALQPFQRVRYRRRGFGASTPPVNPPPTSVEEQAEDAVALLDHLGLSRIHVAGHSLGGTIALELAAQQPERVASLALLEPGMAAMIQDPTVAAAVLPVFEQYASGDAEGAVNAFFGFIGDRDWRAAIDRTVLGGREQAVRDAAIFFEAEVPALTALTFGAEQARAITCPVLSIVGTASSPANKAARDVLHAWFPHCEDADIPGATHLLPMEAPEAVATAIAEFLARTMVSS